MSKISKKRRSKKSITQFNLVYSHAAGLDVSDKEIVAAISPEHVDPVQTFKSFTCEFKRLSAWIKAHKVDTVAMESTGVYWIQLFLYLQEEGFDVYLVNSKYVKNVTGRKTDESDAAWIQKLHSCGLLSNSFQPDEMTRTLRSLMRHRKNLIRVGSSYINRIQKALELMNLKIHTIISDIMGKTGKAIIKGIINGDRDAEQFYKYVDPRIKAGKDEIIKSLEGYWREEHVFELKQCYEMYEYHQQKIDECNDKIEQQLQQMIASKQYGELVELPPIKPCGKRVKKNQMAFDLNGYLKTFLEVDVTRLYGISEITALEIVSETGTNLEQFHSHKHFVSWLGLAPNNKISGGKIISSRITKKKHIAGQAFRMAANSLYRSQNPLGDYYRRIKSKQGAGKAVVATARKLAVIYYNMVRHKNEFDISKIVSDTDKYKQKKIKRLEKYLAKLKEVA